MTGSSTAVVVGLATLTFGLLGVSSEAEAQGGFELEAKLTASDPAEDDQFGFAVAVDNETVIVGAYHDNVSGIVGQNVGSAYIFQRNHGGVGNWGEVTKLNSSDAQGGDEFGESVDISGDTIIVGAPLAGSGNSGAAYIFERDEGGADAWGEVAKLTPIDPTLWGQYGGSVAIDGDTVIVGAPGLSPDTGSAYIHRRDEGGPSNWGLVRQLVADDAADGDWFGYAVDILGDVAIVTAVGHDAAGHSGTGAAYVFHRDTGGLEQWGQQIKLTASDLANYDQFGFSAALFADIAVVGANLKDDGELNSSGAAYVFRRNEGGLDQWGEVTKLTASDAASYDEFGNAVGISVDTILVGSHHDGPAGSAFGSAYLFRRDEGGSDQWGQVGKLTASDGQAGDRFGCSVGIWWNTAVLGASFSDDAGQSSGSAYVRYSVPIPVMSTWGLGVMVLLLLAAGTLVLTKRRSAAAT